MESSRTNKGSIAVGVVTVLALAAIALWSFGAFESEEASPDTAEEALADLEERTDTCEDAEAEPDFPPVEPPLAYGPFRGEAAATLGDVPPDYGQLILFRGEFVGFVTSIPTGGDATVADIAVDTLIPESGGVAGLKRTESKTVAGHEAKVGYGTGGIVAAVKRACHVTGIGTGNDKKLIGYLTEAVFGTTPGPPPVPRG